MTEDAVIEALATFLALLMPAGAPIVRGQENRVPLPPAPCVVLTGLSRDPLETSVQTSTPPTSGSGSTGSITIEQQQRFDVQADFYGPTASDMCALAQTAFRSNWGASQFPAGLAPLFTDAGRNATMTSGEQQYLSRWTLTLSLQYAPSVSVPEQFASQLEILSINPVF